MVSQNKYINGKGSQDDDIILLPKEEESPSLSSEETNKLNPLTAFLTPNNSQDNGIAIFDANSYENLSSHLDKIQPLKSTSISDWSSRLSRVNTILDNLASIDGVSLESELKAKNSMERIREKFVEPQKDNKAQFDFSLPHYLLNYVANLSSEDKQSLTRKLETEFLNPRYSFLMKSISEKKQEEPLGEEPTFELNIEEEFHRLLQETTEIFLEKLSDITDYNEKYKQLKPIFINFLSELKEYAQNEDLALLLDIVKEFTCQATPLYFANMNRIGVAIELLNQFIYPWKVNQQNNNLCGMAVIISIFSVNFPKLFLKNCIGFAEKGLIDFPIKLSVSGKEWRNNPTGSLLIPFLMAAMRNHYNKSGYSPRCLFERLRGATRPKTIVKILDQAGFTEIEEDMVMVDKKGKPISSQVQTLFGGVYSKQHINHPTEEQKLTHLIEQLNEGKSAILLMSVGIMHYFYMQEEPLMSQYLFNLSYDHFVYLVECQIIEEEVSLKIHTYGEEYEALIPKKEFLSHFRGSICAKAPQLLIAKEASSFNKESRVTPL